MAPEDEVRSASEQFYGALNQMLNGNADALGDIWSHGSAVTTMHPIGGREVGWDEVGPTWQNVAQVAAEGHVTMSGRLIRVAGDLAYEVGTEKGRVTLGGQQVAIEHRVTNVYRREGDAWKIVHHHTDLAPAMVEVMSDLLADA